MFIFMCVGGCSLGNVEKRFEQEGAKSNRLKGKLMIKRNRRLYVYCIGKDSNLREGINKKKTCLIPSSWT